MKNIKKFEQYNEKSIQEQIDEILDNLSKKGELSGSEKEFMTAASKDLVKAVSLPKLTGNFLTDMANPHNIGIMWNDGNVWKRLKTVEEEEDERLEKTESSDQKWERQKNREIDQYLKSTPGLEEDLNAYLQLLLKVGQMSNDINKKYRKNGDYKFNQKLDYATNGTLDSLINQFGHYNHDSDESSPHIGAKKK